ncbi:MAG: ABC transporter permease [Thermodesulfobacteriota bacterium]
MIVKIAWRSLWRNRRRTLITVASIGLGLTFAVFFISLAEGVYDRLIDQVVRLQAGHVTVQHEKYTLAPAVDLYVEVPPELRSAIEGWPEVAETKFVVLGQGIAKSGSGNLAASIMGVEPAIEVNTSPLARNLVQGEYLSEGDERLVVIGVEMAERLGLDVGKKLVLSANDARGDLVQELARVKGIFRTGAEEMDAYFVQIPLGFARKLFNLPAAGTTQLGVILKDPADQDEVLERVRTLVRLPTAAVLPWAEVMPDVASYIKVDRASNLIFQGILIFLILFTIFNTILMSVLERQREFAVLLAIGTRPGLLRWQLLWEAVFLGLVGCAVGLACGAAVMYLLWRYGLDFTSLIGENITISGFAVSTKMYGKLSAGILFHTAALVFAATLLLSLLPMGRATKVNIVDTLR